MISSYMLDDTFDEDDDDDFDDEDMYGYSDYDDSFHDTFSDWEGTYDYGGFFPY